MKAFLNAISAGVALTAGVISIFQNVPFVIFIKRVGITFIVFYFAGALFNVVWNSALIRFENSNRKTDPEKES